MFSKAKDFLMLKFGKKKLDDIKKVADVVAKKLGRQAKSTIRPITENVVVDVPVKVAKRVEHKKTCTYTEHDCLAIQLTNRIICMIEEYEANMKRIENHPTLSKDSKSDIQNYINKNIITALWVLEPAFVLINSYPRAKMFKALYTRSINKDVPGLLDEVKHV